MHRCGVYCAWYSLFGDCDSVRNDARIVGIVVAVAVADVPLVVSLLLWLVVAIAVFDVLFVVSLLLLCYV